jgi:replicative DNA helicase
MSDIMPSAVDIEKSVLASCLVMPEVVPEVVDSLDKTIFYRGSHQIYFEAIKYLSLKKAPIDLVSIGRYIKDNGYSDSISISELAAIVDEPASTNLNYHIKKLREKFVLRSGIEFCNAAMKRFRDETADPEESVEYFKSSADKLDIEGDIEMSVNSISDLLLQAPERYQDRADNIGRGIVSGYHLYDDIIRGYKPGTVNFLAARPSMGKTALALNMALNMRARCGIFSLEQTKEELTDRAIAIKTRIDLQKFDDGRFTNEEWSMINGASQKIFDKKIYIDDTPGLRISQIRARSRKLKRKFDIGIIIIDYLQLIVPPFNKQANRNIEIGEICRQLKTLAKDLKIPVLCLSQLNRGLENRPNPHKVPRLADLRDSGEIEQVADTVTFIYRPEVYNDTESWRFDDQADIIVAKNRQGPTGFLRLFFRKEHVRFDDPDLIHANEGRN